MDLRLIALDLDGTTLNSQGKVSPYTKKILEKALSKGILVVIASGRALSAIPEDILNIRGLKYIITSNGSSIFELPDSRGIYANDMKPGVVMSVLAIMQDTHFPFEVFIGGHAYTMQAYYDCPTDFGVPERMNHYVQTTRTPISDMPDFMMKHCNEIEGIDMIVPDMPKKQQLITALSQISNLYITSSESYYIEMASGSVSKASALHALAAQFHITPKQVMAFGDSDNDIELLSYAGCGVAMQNATSNLLKAASAVTRSNNEDGVAFYLESFL